MGKSRPSEREAEFALLLAQLSCEEIEELYGEFQVLLRKRGIGSREHVRTFRRWWTWVTAPIVIGG